MHGDEDADQAIGMFMNTLPIRVSVGDESVAEGIHSVQKLLGELLTHERAPLVLSPASQQRAAANSFIFRVT